LTRLLVDTAVFVYADGGEHRYREPCRRIIGLVAAGDLELEASVELVQEFAHVQLRSGRERAVVLARARRVADLCMLHPADVRDGRMMLRLLAEHDRLMPRDALFAATALNRGIDGILSPDRDFDGIAGLERVDPLQLASEAD